MATAAKKTPVAKKTSSAPAAAPTTSMAAALSEVTDLLPAIKKSNSSSKTSAKKPASVDPEQGSAKVTTDASAATDVEPGTPSEPTGTPVLDTTNPDPVVARLLSEETQPSLALVPDQTLEGASSGVLDDSVDTETQSSSLNPAFFDLEDAPASTTGTLMRIKLYGPGCLECSKLVDGAESAGSATPECHVSRGNEYCPAREVHIEFVGERVNFLRRIRKAQDSGNASRVLRLLGELDNKPSSFKKAVLQELNLLRNN